MKTLQQLYTEIMGSDELKKTFAEAAKDGKVVEFLKANGCEATAEEIKAFLKEKADQPLSDAELDGAAGGGCNENTMTEAEASCYSLGIACAIVAILSAAGGHVGQRTEDEGRLCN